MGPTKLVTVIIPVFNREENVRRAMESVLKQAYSDWELVVVDDCSTDQSFAVASGFNDARIKIIKTQKNSGAAAARNLGIRNSTSPYIALLDSDDMYHPEFLRLSLQCIQTSEVNVGFSYTGVGNIGDYSAGDPVPRLIWTLPERFSKFKKPYLYQLQLGTAAGIVIKREVFNKVGFFDESFQASEDTDWFIRVSEFYKGLPIHKNLIFKDNDSQHRLTMTYWKNANAYRIIIAKNLKEIQESAFLMERWYYKSMWLNFYNGDRSAAASDYKMLRKNSVRNLKIGATYLAGLLLPAKFFIQAHKQLAKLK